MFKFVVIAAFIAVAAAQYNHHGQEEHYEQYAHPKYEFKYGVNDPKTGDQKSQHETRDGDVVKGEYMLVEPDGTVRKVEYTADKHNGFNAIVTRSGHATHPAGSVAHQAAPAEHAVHHVPVLAVHHAAPVVHNATPVHHAAPSNTHEHGHATSYASIVSHHQPAHQTHH